MQSRTSTGQPSRHWPGEAQDPSASQSAPVLNAQAIHQAGALRAVSLGSDRRVIGASQGGTVQAGRQTDSLAQSAAFNPSGVLGMRGSAARQKSPANYNQMGRKDIMGRALGPVKNVGAVELEGRADAEIQTLGFGSQAAASHETGQTAPGPIQTDTHAEEIDGVGINQLQQQSVALIKRGNDLLKKHRVNSKAPQKGSP